MSRIKKTGESIQRKLEEETEKPNDMITEQITHSYSPVLVQSGIGCLSPGDEILEPQWPYKGNILTDTDSPFVGITEIQNPVLPEKLNVEKTERPLVNKEKVTFYLSKEIMSKFNEVFAKRMMRNEKMNRSELICRAIDLLWKEEKTYEI